ncbi:dihydrofolate reductase [Streptomyces sp. HNM0575]|uniref:dihydrofolate reductase family protein n=1 Tax=Streptomyces sp. HNM0575 TaxID=2716338 RepID=UPI00145D6251|nr:dihydrofolate reductase family protein [Streptomyces sp. HNM0575]NLU71334.1 dihydrofolate reductase [Streptomyces sp. HNM0575]
MRKIVLPVSLSLDGCFEGPDGGLDWHMVDDELHTHFNEQLRGLSAFLMGRVNYELMSRVWPNADADPASSGPEAEFAGIWRETPKIVFSRTLERADDPETTVEREVDPARIRELKRGPGGDMSIGGSVLAEAFRRHDLIDEYRVYVHPVILGGGRPFFEPSDARTPLALAGTRTFGNGVVLLHYTRTAPGRAVL